MLDKINQDDDGITLSEGQSITLNRILLNSGWLFREEGSEQWLEAQVPGCNFTDLHTNHKIEDPFYGENEEQLQWIEERNWEYKCLFRLEEEFLDTTETEIVFEGLDTYCEVFLNGHKILTSDNMFIAHRIMCQKHLKYGENDLHIRFRSPILEVRDLQKSLGIVYPAENDRSLDKLSVFTRKAPYHFGWDWGPRFVTSGVWKPVYLQPVDVIKISNVHVTQYAHQDAEVKLDFDIEITALEEVRGELTVICDQAAQRSSWIGIYKKGANRTKVSITILEPELWWPNGLGEASLYEFSIELRTDNLLVSTAQERIGIRTIEVINEPDSFGQSFYLKVNGHPVFMKGANYIPSDSFLSNVTAERYKQLFNDVRQSNMNMLRVWGGGVYEDDNFYDLADEYGILVWQDFMFACTLYPGTDQFIDNVRKEAIYNIKRLRNHACLALWCGNNEVEMGLEFWDWKKKFGYPEAKFERLKKEYHLLFREVLPRLVTTFDTGRFYFPSSPIGFWEVKSDDSRGDNHYWGVWHGEEDFDAYRKRVPRFMSEYGFQSFPLKSSVDRFIPEDDQYIESLPMQMHQKHPRGNRIINETILKYHRAPKDFESFLYLSQVVQAEGLKVAFEAHRKAMPFCMGSLYWQLNDCWPVASWSGIDYYGKWKALHYQAKRSYAKYLVLAEMHEDSMSFYIISDSLTEQNAMLSLVWKSINGQTIREKQVALVVKPNISELVLEENISNRSDMVFFCKMHLTVDDGNESDNMFYMQNIKDVRLPKPDINYKISEENGIITLELMSATFVKSLYIDLEGIEGNLSDNFFDLIPYECATVHYKLKEGEKPGKPSFLSVYDTYSDGQ